MRQCCIPPIHFLQTKAHEGETKSDPNGNRETQNELRGATAEQTQYSYDKINRLLNYDVGPESRTYTYDGYNRKTEVVEDNSTTTSDRTYHYDLANRLEAISDSITTTTTTYDHDENGNTLSRTSTTQPSQDAQFEYDVRDQLTQVTLDPSGAAEVAGRYDYDADGLRIRTRQADRPDIDTYYDEQALLEERDASTHTVIARYHYGEELVRMDQYAAEASPQYYHHDALGVFTGQQYDAAPFPCRAEKASARITAPLSGARSLTTRVRPASCCTRTRGAPRARVVSASSMAVSDLLPWRLQSRMGVAGNRMEAPGSRMEAPGNRMEAPGNRMEAPGNRMGAKSNTC